MNGRYVLFWCWKICISSQNRVVSCYIQFLASASPSALIAMIFGVPWRLLSESSVLPLKRFKHLWYVSGIKISPLSTLLERGKGERRKWTWSFPEVVSDHWGIHVPPYHHHPWRSSGRQRKNLISFHHTQWSVWLITRRLGCQLTLQEVDIEGWLLRPWVTEINSKTTRCTNRLEWQLPTSSPLSLLLSEEKVHPQSLVDGQILWPCRYILQPS